MKKMLSITALVVIAAMFVPAQEKAQENKGDKKPKATYQVGDVCITVWENKGLSDNIYKNFKIEKKYKDKKTGKWKSSSYFYEDELLQLKAALDKAISEESVKTKAEEYNK